VAAASETQHLKFRDIDAVEEERKTKEVDAQKEKKRDYCLSFGVYNPPFP
jgi:hypothetical protein